MIGMGKINYDAYGKTFHFSAFVIYGLLFCGLSKHLEKLNIEGSRNIFYSVFLTMFNISVFEHFYGLCFMYFQRYDRNLLGSYLRDFPFFWLPYFGMLILGLFTILALHVDSYLKDGVRHYIFQPNGKMFLPALLCVVLALLWIYYPLPITIATRGNWVSSPFFPQTRYSRTVYIRNDMLHLVNVITKAMFAIAQLSFIRRFRK